MEQNNDKLKTTVLALLGVFEFGNGRIWKQYDLSVMDDLIKQGLITDSRGHRESALLVEAWRLKAKSLAAQFFGVGMAR